MSSVEPIVAVGVILMMLWGMVGVFVWKKGIQKLVQAYKLRQEAATDFQDAHHMLIAANFAYRVGVRRRDTSDKVLKHIERLVMQMSRGAGDDDVQTAADQPKAEEERVEGERMDVLCGGTPGNEAGQVPPEDKLLRYIHASDGAGKSKAETAGPDDECRTGVL